MRRTAGVSRQALNIDARTVELSFSSETDAVERWFGVEILGHAPGECNLERLTTGAPVLWMHDWRDQRGVVESARVDSDGKGRAVVRFGRSPEAEQLFQDVVDGIVTKVSVGYTVQDLELVEVRDGVDVFRITGWTPHEISMVSVPADDTVGVGRTAQNPENLNSRSLGQSGARSIEGNTTQMNEIEILMGSARNAVGYDAHYDGNGEIRHSTPKVAGSIKHCSVRELEVPAFAASVFDAVHFPLGTEAGKRTTLPSALMAGSRALAAGARLIVGPNNGEGTTTNNGELVFQRHRTRFDVIEAAPFASLLDDQEVSESALPIHSAAVEWGDARNLGFRVALSRADQRAYKDGQLADEVLAGIVLGLARTADTVLLDAIMAHDPEAFALSAAAAAGFKFAELRALVGSAGDGAVVGQDGTLRAAGVSAELTPSCAATVVGAFNRAAVAVHPDITVIAERRDVQGEMKITCWATMQALLPQPGAFWTVEA